MRKAPQLFNDYLNGVLRNLGMVNLKSEPTFYQKGTLNMLVHVDGLVVAGPEHEVNWLFGVSQKVMRFNRGPVLNLGKVVKFLGKEYTRTHMGFTVKHSRKYFSGMLEDAGLMNCKAARSPSTADLKPNSTADKLAWEAP